MSVENKIRELLNKKQLSEEVLDEKVAGDTTNPKQGSSEDASPEGEMGASKGKDTSIPAKVAGDQTQPRQGDSQDSTISSERDEETANPGAKEAAPVNGNQGTISQGGPGDAPNFTTHSDPASVVNQPNSKGNVHQEETEEEGDDLLDEAKDSDHGRFAFDMKSKEHMNSAKNDLKAAGISGTNRPGHSGGDHVLHVKGSAKAIHAVMKKHAGNMHDANMESIQTMNDNSYGHRLSTVREEVELEEDFTADLATLFDGNEDLSEEFRGKASSLFEAMVTARVSNQVQQIEEDLISEAAELMEEFKSDLTDKVDSYLNYVVEKWVEENQLAVENGLRTDIAESFINGMKNLFAEHYIDVPEEKYDVLGEMQAQLEEVTAMLDEAIAANVELHNSNVELMKEGVFAVVAEDLAKTDAEKFKSLVADVEFENAEIFEEKLNVIKENYFPASKSTTIVEDKLEDEGVEVIDESTVNKYVEALNKMAQK